MDIIEYLEEKGIEYQVEGKNVSSGWIGVNCPFCPDGDPSWHMGINLSSLYTSCFRCGNKGYITKLVEWWEGGSLKKVKAVMKALGATRVMKYEPYKKPAGGVVRIDLPSTFSDRMSDIHRDYLINRRFDPDYIANKYKLKFAGEASQEWKFRIIIPYFLHYRMMTFTGRDVTGLQAEKYRNSPNNKSIIPVKHMVYNLDSVKKGTAIVVEGVTDVWRLGDGAVATTGTQYTSMQCKLLRELERVFILFDSDATQQAYKLGYQLTPFINHVEVIELDKGDPADLSDSEVEDLKAEIFGQK